MQVHIETLVKLQAVDLELRRVGQELRALPAEESQAAAGLTSAERKVAEVASAIKQEEESRTKLERDITNHRKKAVRFREQVDTVTTTEQAAAVEKEIAFEESEADRLENAGFASLEKSEELDAALIAARKYAEDKSLALNKTRERIALREKEYKAEQERLGAERDALRVTVEADLLGRYDRMTKLRGTGLARAENQQCTGCRMGVRPQTWNELRDEKLLTCDSCGRLLYWDPALEAAPAAEPDAAKAAGGRAIRK